MKESEEIVTMMESRGGIGPDMPGSPCGPDGDKCKNTFKKDGGRSCANHHRNVEIMSQAFWTVVELEEQGR